ncbi:ABC-2 family transporter protein [Melissococcus plutonius]|uniref:ABC transporter permease n=2 Tax=Melissococcus plutonius TaxID=33970 RepID=F3YB83_MELPT|nr:ABC-2 family transporter protein [Melissococcus plutonius]BAL61892.1 hypothetical protein MPD5_0641 [Melissococcus plutonius DAT561]KMT31202.1 ABC-type putative transport system, permease component [Melissococcus plutonius]KMT33900.1 ABC-type putative transport system, permease component [Melissococcus plutonius]KMT39851.1 ABC-type putative transport system, permease component [Melissococcus plutonius]MBB5178574.1 ABC-2 type transport system permease protein [Melissococcus plutonius]
MSVIKYFVLLKMVFKSNWQYKTNFLIGLLNQLFVILFEFIGMLSLFSKFGTLSDWSVTETFLLYGIVNFSFSFSEVFFRGFESNIQDLIRGGQYDRYLLRPYSTLLQISAFNFQPVRFGRLLLATVVLLTGAFWNISSTNAVMILFYLPFVVLCGCFLYSGIYILVGSLTFIFSQYIEFTSIFVQGSVSLMQYPKSVFPRFIQTFFTYILPVSLISFYPVSLLLGKYNNERMYFYLVSPLIGILFFVMAYFVFKILEKHYSSSGN